MITVLIIFQRGPKGNNINGVLGFSVAALQLMDKLTGTDVMNIGFGPWYRSRMGLSASGKLYLSRRSKAELEAGFLEVSLYALAFVRFLHMR